MTRQAVECFKMQTASCFRAGIKQRMLILDTSEACPDELLDKESNVLHIYRKISGMTIGELRNHAIQAAVENWKPVDGPDIIIHWDSDDFSHPNRIAEQVQLLQSSGSDCVGYREMLFWRETWHGGQAWLYTNANPHYALGTSLAYKREVWERKPFEATSHGEDERFLRGLKVAAVSSLCDRHPAPRMIARIHSANTSTAYSPGKMEAEARKPNAMWKRVPMWDSYCAETMK
jgi:hypothetical protein